MDLKTVWLDLKNTIHVLFTASDVVEPNDNSQVRVDNLTLVWKPAVNGSFWFVNTTTNYASISFTLDDRSEYEWLTKDYEIGLEISISNRYKETNDWEATITVKSRSQHSTDSRIPDDYFLARLSFTVSFGPVVVAGIASTSTNEQNPFTIVTCAGDSVKQVVKSSFCWPATASPNSGCAGTSLIREVLREPNCKTPAVCTVQVRRISKCSRLAGEVSRATAKLLATPNPGAEFGSLDVIRVVSRERPFAANLDLLSAASSVIAACFRNATFIESQKRQFDLSSFSQDVVEVFLHFCSYGTVPPRIQEVSVDLAKLSHQYGVNRLLLICEVFLVRDLVNCSSMKRLGELAEVAVKLELPLLLTAFEIVLKERQSHLVRCGKTGKMGPWAGILKGLPGFEEARVRAHMVLESLDLSDDCAVISSDTADVEA